MNKKHFIINTIALDEDGIFWVHYIGDVPEQGGMHFGNGSVGFHSLKDALNFADNTIRKNLIEYHRIIKDKEFK